MATAHAICSLSRLALLALFTLRILNIRARNTIRHDGISINTKTSAQRGFGSERPGEFCIKPFRTEIYSCVRVRMYLNFLLHKSQPRVRRANLGYARPVTRLLG
ncbi:hypothetical protein C8R46DRAFT_1143800 [Mycena filopes]|nr:hypothetical protein C8R46DRAFT_1143621 [Mycena filopes]KAJ7129107.1 hypothetical protein C8R46DRAFT_1143800 [Mycena filopes]